MNFDIYMIDILQYPILSYTIFLPIVSVMFLLFCITGSENNNLRIKLLTLISTIATFILSLLLLFSFDKGSSKFQYVEKLPWFEGSTINYFVGIDGISLSFILLTTFLMPLCILASWNIKKRVREYMIAFLVLETFTLGVFAALDFILFYVFFEAVLIPMFLIIGIWGGRNRLYSSFKFFLYTLFGSVLFLIALIFIYQKIGTSDVTILMIKVKELSLETQKWLWLAFFISFAIKVPMFPLHTWLPDAHVEAPTAGSMILAGILIKMGAYAFIRFSLTMLPDASVYYQKFIFILSAIAVIYTSLVALVQHDMKKLIAYSSVAHMGFVTIGIFAVNQQAIEGAIFQMVSHGLVSAALFFCVGVIYQRTSTRIIAELGGVASVMPKYALFFLFFTMAAIGLPMTSGFVGEFLVMVGLFKVSKIFTAIIAIGVILSAAYMLWLYARVMFGEIRTDIVSKISDDIDLNEKIIFVILALSVLILGIYPKYLSDLINIPVLHLIDNFSIR